MKTIGFGFIVREKDGWLGEPGERQSGEPWGYYIEDTDEKSVPYGGVMLSMILLALTTCNIPSNVTIEAMDDPCSVYHKVEIEWAEASGRVWFANWTRNMKYQDLKLEEAGPIRVKERIGAFVIIGENGKPALVYGFFNPNFGLIEYAGDQDSPRLRILMHEILHWRFWLQGEKSTEWLYSMHGVKEDPLVIALNAWLGWTFPVPVSHPYFPAPSFLPVEKPPSLTSVFWWCGTGK